MISDNREKHSLQLHSLLFPPCSEQKNITAESGQDVTLPCRAPNNNTIVVEWRRADLDEYVLLYRDEGSVLEEQHPSFMNRVDLQDRQMKDGDVSLIVKDVTINDTGTYECHVVQREPSPKKRLINNKPICIMDVRVEIWFIFAELTIFAPLMFLSFNHFHSKDYKKRYHHDHITDYFDEFLIPKIIFV
uniref:Ig-like domain-containing protein n=1 Tax=Astatotilapia calliptera TaxID=8154 RepID=A0A3P8PDG2_ASTCA